MSGTATMTADGEVREEDNFLAHANRAGRSIKVGGDYLGRGDTPTAESLYVGPTTLVLNDAIESGDAGRTIFWSDDTTACHGTTIAWGGKQGGHGGFVESSGKINLTANGFVDLSPRHEDYNKGTYLPDPTNTSIFGGVNPNFQSTNSSIDLSTSRCEFSGGCSVKMVHLLIGCLEYQICIFP